MSNNKSTKNSAVTPMTRYNSNAYQEPRLLPLLKTLFRLIWTKLSRLAQAISHKLSDSKISLSQIWRVGLIGVLVFVLFRKDFNFQLNYKGQHSAQASILPSFGLGESSEFAPADPTNMRDEHNLNYIRQFRFAAIQEMHQNRIPASITLAQAIIESRSGDSRLAKDINNHFGLKCFSKTCKPGHCKNYTDDSHKDFFRAFKNVGDSYSAHSKLLLNSRYTSRVRDRRDYRSWAYALQDGGYATGKQYAKKLIYVIERYKLYELDRQ